MYDPHQHMKDNPPRRDSKWDHKHAQWGSRSRAENSAAAKIIAGNARK